MYTKKDLAERMSGGMNPFLENWKFPVTKGYSFRQFVKDEDGISLPKPFFRERGTFVQLFYDDKSKEKVQKLSDRAQRMYLYILYHLPKNCDYITLDPTVYMEYNEIKSPTTFKLAKMELMDAGFIQKANPRRTYWLNPSRFFHGSRPNKFPNNRDIVYEL